MNNLMNNIYKIQTKTLKLRRKHTKLYVNFTDSKIESPVNPGCENSYLLTVEPNTSLLDIKNYIKAYFRKRGFNVSDNRSGSALIIEWKN